MDETDRECSLCPARFTACCRDALHAAHVCTLLAMEKQEKANDEYQWLDSGRTPSKATHMSRKGTCYIGYQDSGRTLESLHAHLLSSLKVLEQSAAVQEEQRGPVTSGLGKNELNDLSYPEETRISLSPHPLKLGPWELLSTILVSAEDTDPKRQGL